MKETGQTLGIPVHVFGPETHMTAIVAMAMGKRDITPPVENSQTTANFLLASGVSKVGPMYIIHEFRSLAKLVHLSRHALSEWSSWRALIDI